MIIFKWLWLRMVIVYCLNIAAPTGSSQESGLHRNWCKM